MATRKKTEVELVAEKNAIEAEFENTEVATQRREQFNRLTEIQDAEIDSWDDAVAVFAAIGIEPESVDADLIGDGFPLIDKSKLVNVECMFVRWTVSMPQNERYKTPYVVVKGITRGGKKFRFTDGSTGVGRELFNLTRDRAAKGHEAPNGALILPEGLSRSDYTAVDDNGDEIQATTYHIAVPSA